MNCEDVLQHPDSKKCICTLFRGVSPPFHCELNLNNRFSPGPVQSDEFLIRFIYSPEHLEDDKIHIKPSVFAETEISGCSVYRVGHITLEKLGKLASDYAARELRNGRTKTFVGAVVAKAKDVRDLVEADRRIFGIYDTGTKAEPAHSDICQGDGSEGAFLQLLDCFGNEWKHLDAVYVSLTAHAGGIGRRLAGP